MAERYFSDHLKGVLNDPGKSIDQKLNAIIDSQAPTAERIRALQTVVRGNSNMRSGLENNDVVMVCTVIVNREMRK